jgi:hypothetical protein
LSIPWGRGGSGAEAAAAAARIELRIARVLNLYVGYTLNRKLSAVATAAAIKGITISRSMVPCGGCRGVNGQYMYLELEFNGSSNSSSNSSSSGTAAPAATASIDTAAVATSSYKFYFST